MSQEISEAIWLENYKFILKFNFKDFISRF